MGTRQLLPGKLFIVCEGEKTENHFCRDLIKAIEDGGNDGKGFHLSEVDVYPVPTDNTNPIPTSRNSRPTRKTNSSTTGGEEKLSGKPPLNWIEKGLEGLKKYSEVWVLFDNDNHPAREEAFQKAAQARAEGFNFNVVYSSWSFEYYMLLHFEYLYYPFTETEHKGWVTKNQIEKYVKLGCCTDNPKDGACDGNIINTVKPACISGYARKRNYWKDDDSKKSKVFELMGNMWKGICHAHSVKWETIRQCYEKEHVIFHELNPFPDTYRMTLRLMKTRELSFGEPLTTENHLSLTLISDSIEIENKGITDFLLIDSHIQLFRYNEEEKDPFKKSKLKNCGKREIISPNKKCTLPLNANKRNEFYLLDFGDGERIFLRIPENTPAYDSEFLKSFQYNTL